MAAPVAAPECEMERRNARGLLIALLCCGLIWLAAFKAWGWL